MNNLYKNRESVSLIENIAIPSDIHVYSLGIEYMRNWFLSKFDKDFFKLVYVNGKHVFDDFSRFNREQMTVIKEPALAIIPTVDFEYDREGLDLHLGGIQTMTRRSVYFNDSVFTDRDKNMFFGVKLKQQKMNFTFKIREMTRARQMDLANRMKYMFRVKATQGENINYDFHIPDDIIFNIAKHAGFSLSNDPNRGNILKIDDIIGFLSYVNKHSTFPILYKLRTINGNSEFFMRTVPMYTHIDNTQDLSIDEGERVGSLDKNFSIEMSCTLLIPAPQYYYYYSKDKVDINTTSSDLAGLYQFKPISPPERNDKGWDRYLYTEWIEEEKIIHSIDFNPLLENNELMQVIDHVKTMNVHPSIFVEFKLYNAMGEVPITMDWDNMNMIAEVKLHSEVSQIGVYVDLEYFHNTLTAMRELGDIDNRLTPDTIARTNYEYTKWDKETDKPYDYK